MANFNSFLYVYQRVYGQSLMPQRTIAFDHVRWLKKTHPAGTSPVTPSYRQLIPMNR